MPITRRDLFKAFGAAALLDAGGDPVAARAAAFISAYSAEGFHRTATAVDRRSADHLVRAAADAGVTASLEPFDLDRVDPGKAFVQIGGRRLTGLPMFDGPFTSADGIRGTVGVIGGSDPIGWTRISPNGEVALRRMRQESSHRAIVAVTTGAHPGLCPVKAQYFDRPFGPPVLLVSSTAADAIADAARQRRELWVVAPATRTRATAVNVIADVRGSRADLSPLCVMTPRSGWHDNAAERGGGLVCWLAVLRAVARQPPARTVRFVASSGHELGHLGLHEYLRRRGTIARDASVWLHFGANIGAAGGQPATLTCSEKAFDDTVAAAFGSDRPYRVNPQPASQARGEAATILEGGGRFSSFIGQNDWFHNTGDRWPDAVDVAAVARFARATAALALALSSAP